MTLTPADPRIDPKINVQPQTRGIKPMIRTVTPQECRTGEMSKPVVPSLGRQK